MKKILIIEDDSFIQDMEAKKLRHSGYDVIFASTGEDALKKINESGIDIILLDIKLPNFDGFEILKTIKQNPKTKDIPVIVYSNESGDENIKRAKELGANKFMIKSNFTLEELRESIEELIN